MNLLNLIHHRFINVQTTGGIHQQHVVEFELRFLQRGINDINRLLTYVRREEINANLLGQRFQLLDRRRAIDVSGNHQHFLLVLFTQELTQLRDAGGFTRPCKPAISTTAGGCAAKSSAWFSSPIAATSSLRTILTNSWPGSGFC